VHVEPHDIDAADVLTEAGALLVWRGAKDVDPRAGLVLLEGPKDGKRAHVAIRHDSQLRSFGLNGSQSLHAHAVEALVKWCREVHAFRVGEAQTLLINLGRDHVERDHPPVIATRLIIVSFRSLLNDLDRLVNFIVAIDGVSGRKLDRNIVSVSHTTSSS